VEKDSGKIIGTSGFMAWNIQHSKAELGYALSRTIGTKDT
jgi:ribosomal-protein-alanine N-acetyltransferase